MEYKSDSERIENLEKIVVDLHKFFKMHHEALGCLTGLVRVSMQSNVDVYRLIESLLAGGTESDRGKFSDAVEKMTTNWNKANAVMVKIESYFLPPPAPPPET